MTTRTIYTLLEETAAQYGQEKALFQPLPTSRRGAAAGGPGKYHTYTWNEFRDAAREIAVGLSQLGVKHGDVIALYSETRAEFYLADFGVLALGAVAAALYTAIPMHEQAETVKNLRPSFLWMESPKALQALRASLGDFPLNAQWALLTGEENGVPTLASIREAGRTLLADDPECFARLHQSVQPDDLAIIYLTSGSTGAPKMGMVLHRNIVDNVDMGPAAIPVGPQDRTLSFLPCAHIAQRVAVEMLPIRMAVPIYFSESLARLPLEMRAVKPTFFLAPPRVWERMYSTIVTEIRKRGAAARQLFYAAVGAGARAYRLKQEGKPIPAWLTASLRFFDRLVYSKIRERLGGEMRVPISGAAPLSKDLADFFGSIGLPILEGFGLTEAGVTTLNPVDRPKSGSIGRMLDGVQAKLAADGELLIGGPTVFAGYYRDPEATRQVLVDGWLYTGDIGAVDEDGYWYITGRKKEIIVSSNGKKIYPARIEGLFKSEAIINQMLLIGDKMPYVTAIFTVNPANAETLDGMSAFQGGSQAQISEAPPVLAEVQKAVSRVNKQLASFEQIRRFKILPRDFSIETGELTPTMKVKRAKALELHRELVAELYAGKEID
jgi:long-chain acyl-CoA synthetase